MKATSTEEPPVRDPKSKFYLEDDDCCGTSKQGETSFIGEDNEYKRDDDCCGTSRNVEDLRHKLPKPKLLEFDGKKLYPSFVSDVIVSDEDPMHSYADIDPNPFFQACGEKIDFEEDEVCQESVSSSDCCGSESTSSVEIRKPVQPPVLPCKKPLVIRLYFCFQYKDKEM